MLETTPNPVIFDENRLDRRRFRAPRGFVLPEQHARTEPAGRRHSGQVIFREIPTSHSPSPPSPTRSTSHKTYRTDSMIRILSAIVASVFALLAASCCCTGEAKPPGLRQLPQFQEIQSAPATPEVHYEK